MLQAIHWLACAYVNGVDDAIQTAIDLGIEKNPSFLKNVRLIKQYGVNSSKYPQ